MVSLLFVLSGIHSRAEEHSLVLTMNNFILALGLMGFVLLIGCTSSNSSKNNQGRTAIPSCTEPENPYDEGTGHYAGYEWAESNGGACGGSSQSFKEGCEEYERQESEYQECEAQKKK
jgi:hypothetical protein